METSIGIGRLNSLVRREQGRLSCTPRAPDASLRSIVEDTRYSSKLPIWALSPLQPIRVDCGNGLACRIPKSRRPRLRDFLPSVNRTTFGRTISLKVAAGVNREGVILLLDLVNLRALPPTRDKAIFMPQTRLIRQLAPHRPRWARPQLSLHMINMVNNQTLHVSSTLRTSVAHPLLRRKGLTMRRPPSIPPCLLTARCHPLSRVLLSISQATQVSILKAVEVHRTRIPSRRRRAWDTNNGVRVQCLDNDTPSHRRCSNSSILAVLCRTALARRHLSHL